MATPTKDSSLPNGDSTPQNSLMGLPTELRLDIFEYAVQEDALQSFQRTNSESGESLFQLWRRLFLGPKVYTIDPKTDRMTRWGLWSSLSNLSTPRELYLYRPRVPAILKTNQVIRGESRELYLKFAKKQMSDYEAKHREMLPLFIDGYEAWKVTPYPGPAGVIGHDEGQKRVEGFELAELCIRWYALKQICEFLERDGPGGVSTIFK